MTLRACAAPPGLVIDCDQRLTDAQLDKLLLAEYHGEKVQGIGRYIGMEQNGAGDCDAAEAQRITSRGFGLWLIQHCPFPGWSPSVGQGYARGNWAVRNAQAIGYPSGAHLELDLEGVAPGTLAGAVADYCNTWVTRATAGDYPGLLYVGFDPILDAQELYGLPDFHAYCSDWGPRAVAKRGFCMRQIEADAVIGGIKCDVGRCYPDQLGGTLLWAVSVASERDTAPDLGTVIA